MKTAEEITKTHFSSRCEGNLVMSINDIEQIQLDAYKAGMTRAAEIAKESPIPSLSSCGNDHEMQFERGGMILAKDDIIVAIEQARDNTTTL